MADAAVEICQAEIAISVRPGARQVSVETEGNDELWAYAQKADPGRVQALRKSLTAILGANSIKEMEYREKCLMKISEKWDGTLLPQLNTHEALAQLFGSIMWTLGARGFRATSDFFVSPCADATVAMIKNLYPLAKETIEPYMKSGALMYQGEKTIEFGPHENLSLGAHVEHPYRYDPFDPFSLDEAKKLIGETFNPQGKFKRFGVPGMGGALQIEPAHHAHQNWGALYDNYDVWLRKIKEMLDPNDVGDWSAYIPPVFP
jgi:hypothetical protein